MGLLVALLPHEAAGGQPPMLAVRGKWLQRLGSSLPPVRPVIGRASVICTCLSRLCLQIRSCGPQRRSAHLRSVRRVLGRDVRVLLRRVIASRATCAPICMRA